jgi:CHASE3 domain sensor protein
MDKLEEQIRKNREDLDRYSPSSGVWKKIKKGLKKDKSPISRWLSIAAMVIVILGTALVFFTQRNRWSDNNNELSKDSGLTPANPHLKETEIYYNNMVNSLYREATPLLTGNPEIENELNTDISHLDSICSEIKKDLKDNIANQEVVEALIQNYRIKIRLLEEMLIILKENENNPEKKRSYGL